MDVNSEPERRVKAYVDHRNHDTMNGMPRAPRSRLDMLRRLEQLTAELGRVRHELKNLHSHDSRIAEVVMRGARLSRERSGLERRLELLRAEPTRQSTIRCKQNGAQT